MQVSAFPALIARPDAVCEAAAFFKQKQISQLCLLADPFLQKAGSLAPLKEALDQAGISYCYYDDFSGEPKLSKMAEIVAFARENNVKGVIGIGGGSALDMAKILSITLVSDRPADDYWMMANPLPEASLPSVMVPTTAGTGSEACSTNIIANHDGHKGWVWGPQTKPDLIILDPCLGMSLPVDFTKWCAMDALIHAFEAASNRYCHANARAYALQALSMGLAALPKVLADGDDLDARTTMLLASSWAGAAIDQVGTSVAHHISHALADIAPIHHGHATMLGFAITLPWLVEGDLSDDAKKGFQAIATHLGLADYRDLPDFWLGFMADNDIAVKLPASLIDFDKAALITALQSDHTQSMRNACAKQVTDSDIVQFVDRLASLPILESQA